MRKLNSTNAQNEKRILDHCGMAYTLSLIGGRWKPGILWELIHRKKVRYSEFKKVLPDISERVLSLQLKELESDKLIARHAYPETPPRVEYELTPLGSSMKPLLESISSWGEDNREK